MVQLVRYILKNITVREDAKLHVFLVRLKRMIRKIDIAKIEYILYDIVKFD